MNTNDQDQQSQHQEEVVQSHGAPSQHYRSTFEVRSRKIKNAHKVQFYLDYGFSQSGPWLQIAMNDTEYGIGYNPGQTFKAREAVTPLRVAPDLA